MLIPEHLRRKRPKERRSRPLRRHVPHALRKGLPATGHCGRFLLQNLLGAGGVCEVHAALDLRRVEWSDAAPQVAVKRLLPELADNYQAQLALAQEFCILRHLAHPGVVRVFDLHREPFGLCYSMELLRGRHMGENTAEAVPDARAAATATLFFGTLAFLHAKGIAHGDIKPSNLFLEPGGRPVLIDFNVAAAILNQDCADPVQGLRHSLRIPAHNILYSSPERLEGGPPSPEDDVFAACCTVYEMFSGEHPFKRRSSEEARREGLIPDRPPGLPALLWPPLRKGLAFQPRVRPAAARLHRIFAAWEALVRCTGYTRNLFIH